MTAFCYPADRERLHEADPRFELIEAEMRDFLAQEGYYSELVCTRWYDHGPVKSGVHATGRARDYRTRTWPPGVAQRLADHLTEKFSRHEQDPYRTAIYETPETHPRATGPHLHVQLPTYPTPWWERVLAGPQDGPV